jgi:hypothetical protein
LKKGKKNEKLEGETKKPRTCKKKKREVPKIKQKKMKKRCGAQTKHGDHK